VDPAFARPRDVGPRSAALNERVTISARGTPCLLGILGGRLQHPKKAPLKTPRRIPPYAVRLFGSDVLEVVFAVVPEGDHGIHVFGLREHKLVLRRLTHQCFRLTSSGQVHDTVLLQLRRHHFQEIVLITFGISDVGLMTFLGPLTKAFPVATIPPQVVEILSVALIRPRLEWPR
jgi:hypothetical protein